MIYTRAEFQRRKNNVFTGSDRPNDNINILSRVKILLLTCSVWVVSNIIECLTALVSTVHDADPTYTKKCNLESVENVIRN